MTQLVRTTQVGFKIEATEGTPETLSASDFLDGLYDDNHELTPVGIARQSKIGVLSPRPMSKGARMLQITGTLELLGGTRSVAPKWTDVLRVMGHERAGALCATVASATGLRVGDRIGNNALEASATKTGIILHIAAALVWFAPLTGSWASGDAVNVYRAGGPSATTFSDAPGAAGFYLRPRSETDTFTPPSATAERRIDGEGFVGTAGRCSGTLMLEADQNPRLQFTYRGVPVLDAQSFELPQNANVTVPRLGATPLPVLGLSLAIDTFRPAVLTRCEFDLGITLTDRPTITDQAFQQSGNVAPRITERAPRITLDPENGRGEEWDFVRSALESGLTYPVTVRHGAVTHPNGLLSIVVPAAQRSNNVSTGDRNGILTQDLELMPTGGADDEYVIGVLFARA